MQPDPQNLQKIAHCLPQDLTAEQFLSEYWQKKPLLIKNGLPALANLFEPADILELAQDEAVNARLISQHPKPKTKDFQWQLKKSPLTAKDFQNLPPLWTVLVQNMEQWSLELGDLWQAFDFIPTWQRDDIMVSYAPNGGSVGEHYDDYDVFLAQGFGQRRWQLGKFCQPSDPMIKDQPIRLLTDMGEIIFDEILQAGDVLYVPPKLAHYGVAVGDCLTFSFGFRRPNLIQILDSLADVATTDPSLFIPITLNHTDRALGELTQNSLDQIKQQLIDWINSQNGDAIFTQAIGESVSKRAYDALIAEQEYSLDDLNTHLENGLTIQIDPATRILYTQQDQRLTFYANGEKLDNLTQTEQTCLKKLADQHPLDQTDLNPILPTVLEWLENGWVYLVDNE